MNWKNLSALLLPSVFGVIVMGMFGGADRTDEERAKAMAGIYEPTLWIDPGNGCEFFIWETVRGLHVERRVPNCGEK